MLIRAPEEDLDFGRLLAYRYGPGQGCVYYVPRKDYTGKTHHVKQ